jgi:hypothetical protein
MTMHVRAVTFVIATLLVAACSGYPDARVAAVVPSARPAESATVTLPAAASSASEEDSRALATTERRPASVDVTEEPQFEVRGTCLSPSGSQRSWVIMAAIVNTGDTPLGMVREDWVPLVRGTSYAALGGGGMGTSVDGPGDGAVMCPDKRHLVLVAAYGRKPLRIVVDEVPAAFRGHRVELRATVQLRLASFERACGPMRVVEREVAVECKPRW